MDLRHRRLEHKNKIEEDKDNVNDNEMIQAVFKDDTNNQKSLFKAYFWLIVGGFYGAHHMYLNNDYSAILTIASCGGCFGLGVFIDFLYLPRYVEQINMQSYWKERQTLEMKYFPRPRWSLYMVSHQLVIGAFFRSLVHFAIPFDGYGWLRFLTLPLASSLGIWMTGKTYNLKSNFGCTLFGSYISYILFYHLLGKLTRFIPLDTSLGAVAGFMRSSLYNQDPKCRKLIHKKKTKFAAALVILLTLQGCYVYNNVTVNIEGTPVPLTELVSEFFNSTAWAETKVTINYFYEEVWIIGIIPALNRLINSWLEEGISEEAAYVLLEVHPNVTSSELKKRFRKLSLQYHPDKQEPEKKEKANKKFVELKAAYEAIMKMRSYRKKIKSVKLLNEISERVEIYTKNQDLPNPDLQNENQNSEL